MLQVDDFKYLVKKTLEEAKKDLPVGYFITVTDEDGRGLYRTMEYNPRRICVWVKGGIIVKVDGLN